MISTRPRRRGAGLLALEAFKVGNIRLDERALAPVNTCRYAGGCSPDGERRHVLAAQGGARRILTYCGGSD